MGRPLFSVPGGRNDWHSCNVISWRLSNSLDVDYCDQALVESFSHGEPEIFNKAQGSLFTNHKFTSLLHAQDVAISMDGKGRATNNVMIERQWQTVKHEEVCLPEYVSCADCYQGLGEYLDYYGHLANISR